MTTKPVSITSKSAFFKLAKGKEVIRTQVGGVTVDEWDEWVAIAKKQLQDQGAKLEDIIETDTELSVKNSTQFWRKPKTARVSTGKLVDRSKDFHFVSTDLVPSSNGKPEHSYGQKGDLKLIDNKLVLTMFNGATIEYTIKQ